MLEQSLRRLQTDHLDFWQIHEVIYYNDPDLIFRPNGAAEALLAAKQQGKVRFVGFTGHKDPAIHLRMLSQGFPFDTVQMPLNAFDATFRSFETQVLPEAQKQGLGSLGHEEPRRLRRDGDAWRDHGARRFALCDEPAGRSDDQRNGIGRRAGAKPRSRARFPADVRGGNGRAARARQVLRGRRALRVVQNHQRNTTAKSVASNTTTPPRKNCRHKLKVQT